MSKLKNKIAVITGGSSGIGLASAFLASGKARWITGQFIDVNAGLRF